MQFNDSQIKKRKSYSYFKGVLTFLDTNPSKIEILKEIHSAVDRRDGWKYRQQAQYAWETIEFIEHELKQEVKQTP